jgi:hypothetical protein
MTGNVTPHSVEDNPYIYFLSYMKFRGLLHTYHSCYWRNLYLLCVYYFLKQRSKFILSDNNI